MKIQTNVIITIGIVLMVVLSVTAFNTFSFAEMTNSTASQSATTNTITAKVPSQMMTTTNPVAQNTTLMSGSGCSNINFLWNHVYGASGDGKHQWSQPGPVHKGKSRLTELQPCVTVKGQVYSMYTPPPPGKAGTHDDPDSDLHFTLALDNPQYSNKDPPCTSSHGLPNPCYNIIVEVICHTTPAQSYSNWGDYCNNVNSVYPHGQFPKIGDKLTVSGKLVRDEDEGWNEIHPASDIHITH